MKYHIIVLVFCIFSKSLWATVYSSDGSVSDTQAKINSAANTDTVQLPLNGSFTWSGGVTISGKGIILDLNGSTLTRGTGTTTFIAVTNNATTGTRITNGTLVQNVTVAFVVTFDGSFTNQFFRLDHCTLTAGSGTGGQFLVNIGQAWGLIDHCAFSAPTNSEMIHNVAYGASNTTGWYDDVTPGSANAVYIEDCSFTNNNVSGNPSYYFGNSGIQGYYGCRTVIRYCTFSMSQIDMHGGPISARWWECYENTFTVVTNGNQADYLDLRGGSGVVFNNYKTGATNLGTGAIHLGPDVVGDDNTYHVGLGKALASDPAYVWNNAAGMTITNSAPVTLNTDYFTSSKPGYTPYTYPNPLAGIQLSSATINAAGTSLTVVFNASVTTGAGGSGGMKITIAGTDYAGTYSSGSGSATYVFTVAKVYQGATATVTYTQPGNGLEATSDGTDVATFTAQAVTNSSTQVIPAPTGPSATKTGQSTIDVGWTDGSAGVTSFIIYRSLTNGSFVQCGTAAAGTSVYHDTGLAAGTQYYYVVASTAQGLTSSQTSSVNATTDPSVAPNFPVLRNPAALGAGNN